MNRTLVLSSIVVVAVVAVAGRALVAQQPPAGPKVAAIEKVKDNLYMVTGGGGNTAVFVTANGVVLVDNKLADWGLGDPPSTETVTLRKGSEREWWLKVGDYSETGGRSAWLAELPAI